MAGMMTTQWNDTVDTSTSATLPWRPDAGDQALPMMRQLGRAPSGRIRDIALLENVHIERC